MPAGQDFFCHLPFVALQTDGVTAAPCCKFQSESRLLLDQYQDHDEILQVKSLLFQGLSPKQCRTCVREEQQTGKSFRTLANDFHPELSAEVRLHDQNYSSLRHVSVSGSNVCNLQCLPCEHGSFKRSTELHALGFYPTIPVLRKLDNVQILSDLPIENLTLCSGEPFYDKQSRKLLELLVKSSKSKNIRLDINTNLTEINVDTLIWLEDNFQEVFIKGSIDGIYQANDYLRFPCDWISIDRHVDLILSRPRVQFVITTALSNLALLTYPALVKYFSAKGVQDFFISQVTSPDILHGSNLPGDIKQRLLEDLHDLGSYTDWTDRTRDVVDLCISMCSKDGSWRAPPLVTFLDAHDRSRQTNWREIWPELSKFC